MTDPEKVITTAGGALTLIERIAEFFTDRPRRRRSAAERAADLRARASHKRISAARARFPGARARRLKAAAVMDAEADMLDQRRG